MYVKYYWNAGASFDDVFADWAALATGETLVANLSAGCDKIQTTIDTTVDGGASKRTLHDNEPGLGREIIKVAATNVDIPKDYYIRIHHGTGGAQTPANVVQFDAYGTWNDITHTSDGSLGAAQPYTSGGQSVPFDPSVAGFAHWFFLPTSIHWITSAGNVGNGVHELIPTNPYTRSDAGAAPAIYINQGNVHRIMQYYNAATFQYTNNTAFTLTTTSGIIDSVYAFPPNNQRMVGNFVVYGNTGNSGSFGTTNPNDFVYVGSGQIGSEWLIGTKTYVVYGVYNFGTIAILKSQ